MPDVDPVLQTTIDVEVDGLKFLFAIPSFKDEIKIGLLKKQIRRNMEFELLGPNPTGQQVMMSGGEPTYDNVTETYVQVAAHFRLLLKQADAAWIYSPDENGKPVADYTKWPDDKFNIIVTAGVQFADKLSRFRSGRTPDNQPVRGEAVAGKQDTENQPVQPGDVGA
jgi:hypothetical protein